MTFSLVNPLGWALYEILTSAQMNALDQDHVLALDGQDGGVYALLGTLELDGGAIPTGATLRLRPGASGPGLWALPDAENHAVLVGGATSMSYAGTPKRTVRVHGQSNSTARPSSALEAYGGNAAGATGPGGVGLRGYGGAALVTGIGGGFGVLGEGGDDLSTSNTDYDVAAGGRFKGGVRSRAGARGAVGAYAKGGAAPTGGRGGFGGYFEGGNAGGGGYQGAGLAALGEGASMPAVSVPYGGVFAGGTEGQGGHGILSYGGGGAYGWTYGIWGVGGGGLYGAGARFDPGTSGVAAAIFGGALMFSNGGLGGELNPVAGEAQTNKLHAKNTIKAWGVVRDGVLIEGYNVASVAIDGGDNTILEVTLAAAMADTNYGIICGSTRGFAGNNPRWYSANLPGVTAGAFDAKTTTFFELQQIGNEAGTPFGTLGWADSECYFIVIGEQ